MAGALMNGINELADIVQRPDLAADQAVREKLGLHVVDTVGAWIAATRTPEGKKLIAFRNRDARRPTSRTISPPIALWCGSARSTTSICRR